MHTFTHYFQHGNLYLRVTELYGIRLFKILLVLRELLALFVYHPKRFFRDLEFIMQKRPSRFQKFIWLGVLPIALLAALWKVWKDSNFFTYAGVPIPKWALIVNDLVFLFSVRVRNGWINCSLSCCSCIL